MKDPGSTFKTMLGALEVCMHRSVARIVGALAATLAMVGAPAVLAATDTTTFTVSANIVADCNLSATNLSFGTYDAAAGSALDGTSTVSVYCSNGLSYDIALNVGSGGGTFATRSLANGGNTLNFNLYSNAGRTTIWGDGTGSTSTVTGSGSGLLSAVTHTVYGRVAAGQDRAIGSYASTITVTVTF
jgi:spore coat protein U-like protein